MEALANASFHSVCLLWCEPCLCFALSASKHARRVGACQETLFQCSGQKILARIQDLRYLGCLSLVLASTNKSNVGDKPDYLPCRVFLIKTHGSRIQS
jgi:hypothetical protein